MSMIDKLGSNDKLVQASEISLCDDNDKKKSQSTLLIEIGSLGKLFHDDNKDAYCEVILNDVAITMLVRSKEFVEYLSHQLYVLTGKGASNTAITDAKNTLESKAKFDGKQIDVVIRVSHVENIYIDLGCDKRRIIEVTDIGWGFVTSAPMKFLRKNGMTALSEPVSGGDVSLLKKYLNIADEDFPLVIGWLLCALAGVKPYPILIFQGEQGTGKSTNTKLLRSLVDPSSVPLRSPPKDTDQLLVSAGNTHVVAMDNLSGLKPEISDCLCRLSTGGGMDKRMLYSDDDQVLIDIQKPVIINGIDDIASRPDLSERSIILNLPVIPADKRRRESEFWKEFELDKPKILAGLLDGLVSGLKHSPTLTLDNQPRMADVAHWVTSCEMDIGIKGEFLKAHTRNQESAVYANIEASPIGSAIMILMRGRHKWIGTPTELSAALEDIAGEIQVRSRSWATSLKGMNNIVRRLKPSFRKIGIEIVKKNSHDRCYEIESIGFYPPQAPKAPKVPVVGNVNGAHCADGAVKSPKIPNASTYRGEV